MTAAAVERRIEDGTLDVITASKRINHEVIEAIARKIPAARISEKIDELLNAKRKTRHGEDIDCRAVEAGVKLWLAYMVGLPVQRVESVSVNLDADAAVGMQERLRKSPALREAIKVQIAAAEEAEKSGNVTLEASNSAPEAGECVSD